MDSKLAEIPHNQFVFFSRNEIIKLMYPSITHHV